MKRLWYIDNLRIFLISLVVLHHLAITYGGPGSWYYNESEPGLLSGIALSMFLAVNQAFFMGLFFFISAYFTELSFSRKGTKTFLVDRFRRLGIPLVIYYFLLSPLTVYCRDVVVNGLDVSFSQFVLGGNGFGFGPLWFVETLLYFSLIYVVYQALRKKDSSAAVKPSSFPGINPILLLALALGLISFLVRVKLPVGWAVPHLGLQFPHFAQYIALFTLGIVAARRGWLEKLSWQLGIRWFIFAQVMIFVAFPIIFTLGGALSGELGPFMGGLTWQSLAYSVWEQVTGLSLMIGLMGIFSEKFNTQGNLGKKLSASAYGVFIFHPPLVVLISLVMRSVELPGFAKFLILAPVTVTACFIVACLIRKIPYADRVL